MHHHESNTNNDFIALIQYKLCKVKSLRMGPKKVPYLITHDARTIRYPNPHIKANDTIQVDIATGKIQDHIKFDTGKI
jgi:small subunit ribosomal protein S4e